MPLQTTWKDDDYAAVGPTAALPLEDASVDVVDEYRTFPLSPRSHLVFLQPEMIRYDDMMRKTGRISFNVFENGSSKRRGTIAEFARVKFGYDVVNIQNDTSPCQSWVPSRKDQKIWHVVNVKYVVAVLAIASRDPPRANR